MDAIYLKSTQIQHTYPIEQKVGLQSFSALPISFTFEVVDCRPKTTIVLAVLLLGLQLILGYNNFKRECRSM